MSENKKLKDDNFFSKKIRNRNKSWDKTSLFQSLQGHCNDNQVETKTQNTKASAYSIHDCIGL